MTPIEPGMTRDQIQRALEARGAPRDAARTAADAATTRTDASSTRAATRRPTPAPTPPVESAMGPIRPIVEVSPEGFSPKLGVTKKVVYTGADCWRTGDELRLRLWGPPRTKKNSTVLGVKQSGAYRRYRDGIVAAMEGFALAGIIPLPDRALGYNVAATYFVDGRGKRADKCGLDQGLYDALENANVISDDWYFRRGDGTRIVMGDPHPRVEVVITPIEG